MGSDHRMQRGVESLFLARQKRRRELARLPIERKIRILLALQKMAGDVRSRAGGARRRPWKIRIEPE